MQAMNLTLQVTKCLLNLICIIPPNAAINGDLAKAQEFITAKLKLDLSSTFISTLITITDQAHGLRLFFLPSLSPCTELCKLQVSCFSLC